MLAVNNMITVRFGSLDQELSNAIAFLLELPTEELLERFCG
ncbi:MAG: hypothetical protein ABI417_20275 [Coleofasciculaceae cyanobacterium]